MSQQLENDRTGATGAAVDYRGAPRAPTKRGPYPEISASSIVFGVLLGALMNAAVTYAGLKIGFTITGSAVAAVLGFGVLRGMLRRGTILEVNMAQTIASTVNTTNAGVIFTIPALVLMGHALNVGEMNFWWITLAATVGAVLGSVYIVPLRKQMIDIDRLRFPSSVAVAAVLRSPAAGSRKAVVLLVGTFIGMLVYFPTVAGEIGLPRASYSAIGWHAADGADRDADGQADLILTGEQFDVGRLLGIPPQYALVFAIAPLSLGAGYLTGRPGLMVLAGGVLVSFIVNPIAYGRGWLPQTVEPWNVADHARTAFNRPLGIGMLLGGALMGIIVALPAMIEAIRSVARAGKMATSGTAGRDEMSLTSIALTALACIVLIIVILEAIGRAATTGQGGWLAGLPPWASRLVIGLVAAVWIWFAGIIISQCTGMTDWSPISGMALLTVVLVLILSGTDDVFAAVVLGCALCTAISCSADMMGDLKTGYLIGASPRRQQVWQVVTAAIGPVVTMLALVLIIAVNLERTGKPIGEGTQTTAPQAQALEAVINGVKGGDMPYVLYGLGAVTGVLLGVGAFPGLGVLVGLSMYLPVMYIFTYGIGCILNMVVVKTKGQEWAEDWGVPLCAGLVVGEGTLALISSGIILYRGWSGAA